MVATAADVPPRIRLEMGHAHLQWVADDAGLRLLHIKGVALDERLRWAGRQGTDADVIVPASDADAYVNALQRHGWVLGNAFENNSSFEHAAALRHVDFGWADVHRYFPGFAKDPDAVFDRLWDDHLTIELAGRWCAVPSLPAQRLVLILHAARSPGSGHSSHDIVASWDAADAEMRGEIEQLVEELDAHVGFAAAMGELAAYRDRPDYELWRVASQGGTRLEEWRARIKAAPTRRAAWTLVLRAPLVNVEHLTMVLWRRPSRREILSEFFARPGRAIRDELRTRRRRRRHRATG
jgi:hypothetical protein